MSCEITNLVTRADHAHFMAVRCTKWVWSAFNAQKFRESRDPSYAPFSKNLRGHVRTDRIVPGNMHVKFEARSLALTILELLASNAEKYRVSCDPGYAPVSKKYVQFTT